MTFNSLPYFLYLPCVYLLFAVVGDRWRWLVLLVASYGFYFFCKAPYLPFILLGVTCIAYTCGLRIASSADESSRGRWFWIGVSACIAILALLKYLPVLDSVGKKIFPAVIISIGVSYFTFQAISYLADLYLEIEEEPERHFGRFALYLAFFPKLLQGPIERAGDMLPQLRQPYNFDYDTMRSGMVLFAWGLFKKVVVADRLDFFVSQIFGHAHSYRGIALLLAIYAYAFQLYMDFSGYTDMARGTGRLFGIRLTENFNSPYLATSIADFWRRWHISFSRWILDYIFKPLQMGWRSLGLAGTALALLVTFFVSGIWHGATWGFVVWGLVHGVYLAASTYYRPYQKQLHAWLGIEKTAMLRWWQIFVTFHLVSLAWVFFRADSLKDAVYIISNLFAVTPLASLKSLVLAGGYIQVLAVLLSLAVLWLLQKPLCSGTVFNAGVVRRWMIYLTLVCSIMVLGSFQSGQKFIYFQF